jgi:hypothetical protein
MNSSISNKRKHDHKSKHQHRKVFSIKNKTGRCLSPLLFNLVANMLNLLISRAKEDNQIIDLLPHLIDGGISTIYGARLGKSNKLETITVCFQEIVGPQKINFQKSEIFCYGQAREMEVQYTELFGCGLGEYPFRYLGIPMHHKKISNAD